MSTVIVSNDELQRYNIAVQQARPVKSKDRYILLKNIFGLKKGTISSKITRDTVIFSTNKSNMTAIELSLDSKLIEKCK